MKTINLKSKKLLSNIIVVFLILALPVFVWALVNLNFNYKKKAASGEPAPTPKNNAVNWSTPYASLSASNFYLNIDNNNLFISNPTMRIQSDPGDDNNTSLELGWNENGVDMFMTFYFKMLNDTWKVSEVRTSDGANLNATLYYPEFGNLPKGTAYAIDNFNLVSNDGRGKIHFEYLNITAFIPIDLPISQYGYILEPKTLTSPDNRIDMYYYQNSNSVYGVNVVLRDENYNIITDQSDFAYRWSSSNLTVASVTSSTLENSEQTCSYGIIPPCPKNHGDIQANGLGEEVITAELIDKQTGTVLATAQFYVRVRSSGAILPPYTDDVFFKGNENSFTITTTDQNPNVSISPEDLISGKTYILQVNYSLQNDIKNQDATSSAIPVVLLINNQFKSSKDIPYSLIAVHRDGASDAQSTSFTATGSETNVEIQFDPNDIFKETNEANNSYTYSFPINPSPSPISTSKVGDVNNDNKVNIIDIGIVIDEYDSTNPNNPRADVNNSGKVDLIDIGIIVDKYEW